MNRRDFLKSAGMVALASLLPGVPTSGNAEAAPMAGGVLPIPEIAGGVTDKGEYQFLPVDENRTILPTDHWTGIRARLPHILSLDVDPRISMFTGFTSIGRNGAPDDDAPIGYMKGAELALPFGLLYYESNDIQIDTLVRRFNRGSLPNTKLLSSILRFDVTDAQIAALDTMGLLSLVAMVEMVTVEVLTNRHLMRGVWGGNPAIEREFVGLDKQITEGISDATTGIATPALDSDVKDFQFKDITPTDRDIVEYLSMIEHHLRFQAQRTSLAPCEWAVAMRPELWYTLTAIWPASFHLGRTVEDDWMRNESKIPINRLTYDVVLDDGIEELNCTNHGAHLVPGQFASTLYFIPLTVREEQPVTYIEYLSMRDALLGSDEFWTDDGMFGWKSDQSKWDWVLRARTRQRVVLRTPQLAAKLMNVAYSPRQLFMEA